MGRDEPLIVSKAAITRALLRGLCDAIAPVAVVEHELVGSLQPAVRVRVEGPVLDDPLLGAVDHPVDEFGVHAAVSVLSHQGVQSLMSEVSIFFLGGGFWKCLPWYSSKGSSASGSPPQGRRGGRLDVPIQRV